MKQPRFNLLTAAFQHIALLTVVLVVWEGSVRLFDVPAIVLPGPLSIIGELSRMLGSARFYQHIWVTLSEIMGGFVLGSIAGILLGTAIGLSPLLSRLLFPYVIAFETMPKVAIAPIIVIWAGYGIGSKVIIAALIVFFPLLANTVMGLRSAPRDEIQMLQAFTASRWQIFRMVQLKHALPHIFTGLDIAIVLSVIGAIVGEFVGAKAGLGYLILQNNFNFNIAGSFAVLFVLSAIGIVLHWIVSSIHKRVVFWVDSTPGLANT